MTVSQGSPPVSTISFGPAGPERTGQVVTSAPVPSTIDAVPDDVSPAALLDVSIDAGPRTTVTLVGDLDPATAPVLEGAIASAVADEAVDHLVLDLDRVSFLDSSGLRVLVTTREALTARGADLALRNPSANIRRLLDITGLAEVIAVE